MTVHTFHLYIGIGSMSVSDLETRVNDWVASNPEWAESSSDHRLSETTSEDGSVTWYQTLVRFTEDDTKANLLQKLTDKLKDKVAYYRVGHHVCPHDEEVSKATVADESVTMQVGTAVSLANDRLSSTPRIAPGLDTEYVEGEDYEVDRKKGEITALSGGKLVDGDTYPVTAR
jgi:hypothetical protein